MATLILTAVGGAIGGRIGGAVGALVGQAIDQTIFAPASRQGPRLGDLSVQTSTYGAAIPKIFGRTRVAGTVIWSTDLIETKRSQSNGKGRGSTDTYSYAASFAVLLSGRRIVRIERIWADGKLLRGAGGDLKVELAALRVHDGDPDQPVDPPIASAEGADAPSWRGQAYAVFEGLQLGDYGNRIPSLSFEIIADNTPVGMGTMIGALAGVSAEAGPLVTGFAIAGSTVRQIAEGASAAFPMRVRSGDTPLLRFATVPVSPPDPRDLGAHAGESRVAAFGSAIAPLDTMPAAVSLAYLDPARDYQSGLQRARRAGGGSRETRIDLPAVLDADVAQRLAYAALSRAGVERTRGNASLPWRAMTLRPGDAISIAGTQWRIVSVQIERMVVTLNMVRTAESNVPASPAEPGRPLRENDAPHGPTTLVVVDLPPRTDAAVTRPSVAVFASGSLPGWRRASLLASVDGGASYAPAGSTGLPAIIGTTVAPLPPGSTGLVDRTNAVEIDLLNASMALTDADMPSLLAGANLAMIGDELIQFGRAVPVSPGRWQLRDLWRGRRGTEDAVIDHPAGSRFVLIEPDAALILPDSLAVPGVVVMASGIGDVAPYPLASTATSGRATMPLSPVPAGAKAIPGGDFELSWIRRSREGWAWRDGVDVPLAEEREAYRVGWEGGLVEVDEPRFVYSAAMRAADVAAGRSSSHFTIRQIGSAALSPPAEITVAVA